jgi:HD-GYP domain-containing protein (c-di-GMP phosphodiesterase class II)
MIEGNVDQLPPGAERAIQDLARLVTELSGLDISVRTPGEEVAAKGVVRRPVSEAGHPTIEAVYRLVPATEIAAAEKWAELLAVAAGAIVAREQELELTARELAVAYSELALAYELSAGLRNVDSLGAVAETLLDSLEDVVAADAAAVLAFDGEAPFMRLAAARGLDHYSAAPLAAAAQQLARQVQGSELAEGAVLQARDIGLADFDGEALVAPLEAQARLRGLLVVARRSPARSFRSGEVKLACAAARQAALPLVDTNLRQGIDSLLLNTVRALAAAVDAKDPYTRGHSQRVASIAVGLGKAMGLAPAQLQELQLASLLHDVGKIGVSTEVLSKPEALNGTEWAMMKSHPSQGAEILGFVPQLSAIAEVVRHHHERLDGSGYPEGLLGEAIPPLARIVAVSDAYDAMTSARPYRGPMADHLALQELRAEGGAKYDEAVVEALAGMLAASAPATSLAAAA